MAKRAAVIVTQPTKFLQCRTIVHPWKVEVTFPRREGTRLVYETHLRCRSCGAERVDTLYVSDGERSGRRYIYPEGYLMPKGVAAKLGGRPAYTRKARVELFSRFIEKNGDKP